MRGGGEGVGAMARQPEQLGRFHLGRDAPAHIVEHAMAPRVDLFRLWLRAVVHPDHHVAGRFLGGPDGDPASLVVHDDQRAGGVETRCRSPAPDRARPSPRGRRRRRLPDLVGRLFDDLARLVPERQRVFPHAKQLAGGIEHARARRARADIHPTPISMSEVHRIRQDDQIADDHAGTARQHEQHGLGDLEPCIRLPLASARPSWPWASRPAGRSHTGPGRTAPTRRPWGASCRRMVWTKACTANFDAV